MGGKNKKCEVCRTLLEYAADVGPPLDKKWRRWGWKLDPVVLAYVHAGPFPNREALP